MSLRYRLARRLLAAAVIVATVGLAAAFDTHLSASGASTKAPKPGDLLVFRAANPPTLSPGGPGASLLDFTLPSGSWLVLGAVVMVRGTSSGSLDVGCTLLESEANVDLPPRHQRNLTLDAPVKLNQAKTFSLKCRLSLTPNPAVSATAVRVTALRVDTITSTTV